jgi:DNA anti-recombination protein RmuC
MTPFGLALDIQRDLLDTGRQSIETSVQLQQELSVSVLEGIESQRDLQRRVLGLQYGTLRRAVRRADEETPGPTTTEEFLRSLDSQLADLQNDQQEAFDRLIETLDETSDALETLTRDSADTADEQLAALTHALEQLDARDLDSLESGESPPE